MGKKGRHAKGGRTTPKGTRPAGYRPPAHDDPMVEMITSGAAELRRSRSAIEAEMWASGLLGMIADSELELRLAGQEVPPLLAEILARCRHLGADGAMVARALGAVTFDPDGRAEAAAIVEAASQRLRAAPDRWELAVGRLQAVAAWRMRDPWGDQESILVEIPDEKGRRWGLMMLVDHNMGGWANDLVAIDDIDEILDAWGHADEDGVIVAPCELAGALSDMGAALGLTRVFDGNRPDLEEDLRSGEAFAAAVITRGGASVEAVDREHDPARITALVEEFCASPEAAALKVAPDHLSRLVELIVQLRTRSEPDPLRLSPQVVHELLTYWLPNKTVLDPADVEVLPSLLFALVRWAGQRRGLEQRWIDETVHQVEMSEQSFRELAADPEQRGVAARLVESLRARGVDLTDPAALEAAIAEINASGDFGVDGGLLRTPPRWEDAPDEMVEAMGACEIFRRFELLCRLAGSGRKLTAKGNLTKADGAALLASIGPQRNQEFFESSSSSADIPAVALVMAWARKAGAVRVEHGKLVATKSWEAQPVAQRWCRVVLELVDTGPLSMVPHRYAGFQQQAELVEESAIEELVPELMAGPMRWDDAVRLVVDDLDAQYEWTSGYLAEREWRERSFGTSLGTWVERMELAGLVRRLDATEAQEYGITSIVGGRLELTDIGRWWLAAWL